MAEEIPPKVPPVVSHPPTTVADGAVSATEGRCHWCGYKLRGLPNVGKCPECGTDYTPESATRLKPWPRAGMICLRIGWPLFGLGLIVALEFAIQSGGIMTMLYGYPMLVAVPINSYFQVRSMLKRSLPEQKRTEGTIKGLRTFGKPAASPGKKKKIRRAPRGA